MRHELGGILLLQIDQMAVELAARDEALRTSDRLRRQMLADVSHGGGLASHGAAHGP